MLDFVLGYLVGFSIVVTPVAFYFFMKNMYLRNKLLQAKIDAEIDELHK